MTTTVDKLKSKIIKLVMKVASKLSQNENETLSVGGEITKGMPEILCNAAEEGAVLLENNGVLPLVSTRTVSVFGRVQIDYFYTGYGSGGDVKKPYQVNLLDGLLNYGIKFNQQLADIYAKWSAANPIDHGYWGNWPRFYPEMPLSSQMVAEAKASTDCAIVIIGRSSGEDRENELTKGSYYLTDEETTMLDNVTDYFSNTILLLNIGSVMDFGWLKKYKSKLGAVMIVWQGGMESGNAIASLLSGKTTPSGHLTNTIALEYKDYPSSSNFGNAKINYYSEDIYVGYRYFSTFGNNLVQYPFGYGLSYAKFSYANLAASCQHQQLKLRCQIDNLSNTYSGKAVLQVYIQKPMGVLNAPARELISYFKTDVMAPLSLITTDLDIDLATIASYDEVGDSGFPTSFVLEKGTYNVFIGDNARDAVIAYSFDIKDTVLISQCSEVAAPTMPFDILYPKVVGSQYIPSYKAAKVATTDLKKIIIDNLPKEIPSVTDKKYTLNDVKDGKISLEQLVSTFSLEDLEAISRGAYVMNSPLGAPGNAGVMGGVTQSLRDKGVPPITTTDGPSGIRLKSACSLVPIGTALASSFNCQLVKNIYFAIGEEMKAKGSDVLLAPGMNIQRNPLCGRNFEYFSEDPLVSGTIAAAAVTGLQLAGVSACPKHFACNNQEFNRIYNNSVLSQRALREIYLRGFQICVQNAKPRNIMTSYNKINGVWGHYHYELCTSILRKEWGYQGNIVTDWWMRKAKSPEFSKLRNNAYRVRAGVNVLMPGGKHIGKQKPDGSLLKTLGRPNGITMGELQNNALIVLSEALKVLK